MGFKLNVKAIVHLLLLSAEQFMFRRSNSRDPNLSVYMTDRFGPVDEEDEEESEEETLASSQDYRRPQLDPISEGAVMYRVKHCYLGYQPGKKVSFFDK